mgnify:CR=1 FL=1
MRGPGTTILVVDDDALITLNTADILNERGHKVLEAFSAQEALSLIEQHPDIGVLITDHNVRETLGICDRAYILNEGSVLAQGAPDTLLANPDVRRVYLGDTFRL